MGVKDLWNILSPLCERKPLHELQGKAVAIDLSCWIVDSQAVTDNMIQPKMYLRNLYFRTQYLLLNDIYPVFVLEGDAPSLKHKTIAKRNELRKGASEKRTAGKGGRTQFNHILKECQYMLKLMGLTCIKGHGEAEAMCAYLNADGLVQGCISQDSDCFLYGAKTVYRNFSTSGKTGAAVDMYSMDKIEKTFDIGRNKMIALALLCGCDYDDGVHGVGKEAALKLFKIIDDNQIIERMKQWKTDQKFKQMESQLENPDLCTNCGHSGKIRSHNKLGCLECGTTTKCSDKYKEKRLIISNELSIRKKALLIDGFPNQELIDEFLIRRETIPTKLDLKWRKPEIVEFICFVEKKLQWEPSYAFAKIFGLATRWQLLNLIEFPISDRFNIPAVFVPTKIRKKRKVRSIASYEILWEDKHNILDGRFLIPAFDNENDEDFSDNLSELISVEPENLVLECYPMIVEQFEEFINSKKKKKAPKKTKQNANDPQDQTKKAIKKRGKKTEPIPGKTIVDFFKVREEVDNLESSLKKMSISPNIKPKKRKCDISNSEANIISKEKTVTDTVTQKSSSNSSSNCDDPPVPHPKNSKKLSSQIDKVLETDRLDSILNGSLENMFNELTPDDFPSDLEDSTDMSILIDRICKTNKYTKKEAPQTENVTSLDINVGGSDTATKLDKNESFDEFFEIDQTYVPLIDRLKMGNI